MAQKIKGITIEIGGNVQPLNKALEGVNKKSRDLQSELKQVDRLLKLDPKNTELLAQKQKLLGEAVSNTKTKLDTLKEAQKQVEEQFRRGEVGEEQYRAIQREVIKAEQDLKSLEKQLKEVNNKWESAGKAVQDFGSKATKVGKSLTKNVTAPILGAAAASQVAWKEVDDALDTVITKTGATGEALEGLEQSFKGVAKTLPADLQTVGDAIGEINTQFGLTGEALEDAAAQAIKFSAINGQDVSKAAIDARRAIEAFQLETKDLGMVLDAVTKTAQDTGQSTEVLFDRVTKGAPQLKDLNLDFAQSVALMGSLEQAGVDSSKALSYLSRAQVNFAKDGKDLTTGLAELIQHIGEAGSQAEALTIATEAFGTRGATFMLDALQRGALDLKGFQDAAENAAGTVESTFESTLDPADKMKVALNNLKLVGADLGGTIQDTLAPMLEKLVTWLQKGVDWFSNLSDGQKKTIVIVGGLAAALGPLLMIIGSIATGIGALMPILSALGGAIGAISAPVLAVVAAVAALAAGVYLVIKNWEPIKEFFVRLWEGIRETTSKVWGKITDFFTRTKEKIVDTFDKVKKGVVGVWEDIWGGIRGFINKIIDGMNSMIRGLNKLKWDIPDWVPVIGGKKWGINIPLIPKLHTGTSYFKPPAGMMEGLAILKRGEQVIPPGQSPAAQEVRHSGEITIRGVNSQGETVGAARLIIEGMKDPRARLAVDNAIAQNRASRLRPAGVSL